MQDYADISILSVNDVYSEEGNSLELRINNTNNICVDSEEEIFTLVGKRLYLNMCGGVLSIPPKIPINIMSDNPVEGIVNTNGYISTLEDLNLIIMHSAPSSIVLDTSNLISINNKNVLFKDLGKYTKTIEYFDILIDYYDNYFPGLQKPKIITDMESTRADFSKSKPDDLFVYEVAVFANALYLKSEGIINIYDKDIKLKEKPVKKIYNKKEIMHDKLLDAVGKDDMVAAEKALAELKKYKNTDK